MTKLRARFPEVADIEVFVVNDIDKLLEGIEIDHAVLLEQDELLSQIKAQSYERPGGYSLSDKALIVLSTDTLATIYRGLNWYYEEPVYENLLFVQKGGDLGQEIFGYGYTVAEALTDALEGLYVRSYIRVLDEGEFEFTKIKWAKELRKREDLIGYRVN